MKNNFLSIYACVFVFLVCYNILASNGLVRRHRYLVAFVGRAGYYRTNNILDAVSKRISSKVDYCRHSSLWKPVKRRYIMTQNIKISFLLFLILYPFNSRAQEEDSKHIIQKLWRKNIVLDKIKLPEDKYCAGHYIISSLQNSGIPICAEYCQIIKGKDVELGIKSELSATDKIWKSVPRSTPWELLTTTSNIASVTEVLKHYARQAGDYELRFINDVPMLLPSKGEVITEKVKVQNFMLTNTCIRDVYQHLGNVLIENYIGWIIPIFGLRSANASRSESINDIIDNFQTNVRFDLKFSGGTLAEVLCEMTRLLGDSDKEHLFFWTLGGLSNQRCLGFGCVEKARYNNLLSDQEDDSGNRNIKSKSDVIIIKYY